MNLTNSTIRQGIVIIASLWLISGCEVLKQVTQQSNYKAPQEDKLCVSLTQEAKFKDFCKLSHWFESIMQVQTLTWPERKQKITKLSESSSALVEKILLSQGVDTPYQHRLRAQAWIEKVSLDASAVMKIVLNELIYENNKQLLEFESAITILSRVNARQEKTISELEDTLKTHKIEIQTKQSQLEQLLKIESDLLEQNRNEER